MITVFDTETTGLVRARLPADDASQPRPLQISAALVDSQRRRRGAFTCLIRPDGWGIEAEAELVHGISEQAAHRSGLPLVPPLAMLKGFVDLSTEIVAHHFEFDWQIIAGALQHVGSSATWWREARARSFCTMEKAAPLVGLPGEFGPDKYPSLEAAHGFFFPGQPYESRHDAEEDRDATERVYWEIKERL